MSGSGEEEHPPGAGSGPDGDGLWPRLERRDFVAFCAANGLAATLFPGALWGRARQEEQITVETIRAAEEIAGISFTPDERELMLDGLRQQAEQYEALHEVSVPNRISPAYRFDPVPSGYELPAGPSPETRISAQSVDSLPPDPRQLAYEPAVRLGAAIRAGRVSSEQLTRMYLDRLRTHGDRLNCVVTLTEELALEQARRADRELERGHYRGPLHGVPWGAKDIIAVPGYPTTWGTAPYRDRVIDTKATIVQRLEDAGAVLLAKLTTGAIAKGDEWYGGKTRNPWRPSEGSSGSSAGPGSATAAGLVGFSVGTETRGSIISPATRCGVAGLRPTYGRVSRHGVMTLSWTMDKPGPMCRTAEDCAVVLDALEGPDGHDRTLRDVPYGWDAGRPLDDLRIGYWRAAFEGEVGEPEDEEERVTLESARSALETLRARGVDPEPIELPGRYPVEGMSFMPFLEAAAAFDEFTRSGLDDEMREQDEGGWPNLFRRGQMMPAVEYIRANRIRSMLMGSMREVFEEVDLFLAPTDVGQLSNITNLTGHPALCVPSGFESDGTPVSVTFVGDLYREQDIARAAHAFQRATDFHGRQPPEFSV